MPHYSAAMTRRIRLGLLLIATFAIAVVAESSPAKAPKAALLALAGQGHAAHDELARAMAVDSASTYVRALRHAID